MRVADTSFLFALHDRTDRFHDQAAESATEPGPIRLPVEVVAETLGLMHRRHGFVHALQALRSWRRASHILFETEGAPGPTHDVFEAADGRLTWVDAAVVAWARARGASALTFDRAILATLG